MFLAACAGQMRNNTTPTMNCDNQGDRGRRASHCEMRERTMAYPGQLNIDGRQNGGVTVKGWSRADVLVRMRVEARADSDAEAKALVGQVRASVAAGRIASEGPQQSDGQNWSVSYEIFTPHQSNLEIAAHNGGVHLSDLRGNIQFHAVNGGVHLARVDGQVKGETTNGGLHIELSGSRWEGQGMDVRTSNGGVHMQIPAGYSAELDTSTVNGGMKIDFAAPEEGIKARHVRTNIGGGGAPLRVATTNGGVHISKI